MNVAQLVTVLIILLLVATGVALLSRQFRVPYCHGFSASGLEDRVLSKLRAQPLLAVT